jgi:hypothetical protein
MRDSTKRTLSAGRPTEGWVSGDWLAWHRQWQLFKHKPHTHSIIISEKCVFNEAAECVG